MNLPIPPLAELLDFDRNEIIEGHRELLLELGMETLARLAGRDIGLQRVDLGPELTAGLGLPAPDRLPQVVELFLRLEVRHVPRWFGFRATAQVSLDPIDHLQEIL